MSTMISSSMMTPEDKPATSWGQYYINDHECEHWYDKQTGQYTWESPHMKKQYSLHTRDDDYTPVMNFSPAEEYQQSSSMFPQSSRQSLITTLDKDCDTTRNISAEISIEGDEKIPNLVSSSSTESLYRISIEEETYSPIEVSCRPSEDRRKSRLLSFLDDDEE